MQAWHFLGPIAQGIAKVHVVLLHPRVQLAGTRHPHRPELTAHHALAHLEEIGLTLRMKFFKISPVDLVLEIQPEQEWEVIVAVDQGRAAQDASCATWIIRLLRLLLSEVEVEFEWIIEDQE